MSLDPVTNFAKLNVASGYTAGATTVVVENGTGGFLPTTEDGDFNIVWFNATDYTDPSDDPDVEIIRCTARSGDTLTVTRGQEGTADVNHNTAGKTYRVILSLTQKMINDIQNGLVAAGAVVQVVNYQTGAVATGTTTIPYDDTIPQNNEGDEYLTLAITPKSSSNLLKIDVRLHMWNSAGGTNGGLVALFQDTTANALAAIVHSIPSGLIVFYNFTHWMTAGTTSATTFKVRGGFTAAGTTTVNGDTGNSMLGGVIPSGITITEVKT